MTKINTTYRPTLVKKIERLANAHAGHHGMDFWSDASTLGFSLVSDDRLSCMATPNWDDEYPCRIDIVDDEANEVFSTTVCSHWTGDDQRDAEIYCDEVIPLIAALLKLHRNAYRRAGV